MLNSVSALMRRQPPSREAARERREWSLDKQRWKLARDIEKGYRVKWGYVAIAYLVEFMVIGASLAGAWLFADYYSDGDHRVFGFMLLAPLVYAAVELCRVPLGILARTQRSWMVKGMALVGILFAAGVTTKSVSQLGEMMFHPRLMDAAKAKTAMKDAQADRATIDTRIQAADARVQQYTAELDQIERRATDNAAQLAGLPAQRCERVSGTNSRGHTYSNLKCIPDPRVATLNAAVAKASTDRGAVTKDLEAARQARAQIDRGAADRKVADTEQAYRNAVNRSQLHSFTAMVYGVDPIDVSDAQVHAFLRIFVFVPALCAAFASTILALSAVAVRRTFMDEDDLGADVTTEATPYLIEHLTAAMREQGPGLAPPRSVTGVDAVVPPPAANTASASGSIIPLDRPHDRRDDRRAPAVQSNIPAAGAGASA